MGYNSLSIYYRLNFALMQHHKWSCEYVDRMYPFEREIYVGLLDAFLTTETQNQQSDVINNPNWSL